MNLKLTASRTFRAMILAQRYGTAAKLKNLARCEIARARGMTVVEALPYFAKIESTNACDLECPYCGRARLSGPTERITVEDFTRVIGALEESLFMVGLHLWGEPLLHPEIDRMVRIGHSAGMATYISTNLVHMDRDAMEAIFASGLDLLNVALDAATPGAYARMKPGGDFIRVVGNVRTLVDLRRRMGRHTPSIDLQMLVTSFNEDEIGEFRRLARSLGVDHVDLKPVADVPDEEWLPRSETYRFAPYRKRSRRPRACWYPWCVAIVGCDMKLVPCCGRAATTDLGDLRKEDFRSVWNGKAMQDIRRALVQGSWPDFCAGCPMLVSPRY